MPAMEALLGNLCERAAVLRRIVMQPPLCEDRDLRLPGGCPDYPTKGAVNSDSSLNEALISDSLN